VRQVFDDLWRLDAQTWTWTLLAGSASGHAGVCPPARSACGMACCKGHVIVFGGKSAAQDSSAFLGDLWTFDESTQQWCAAR
jgi:Kelch motif